MFEPGESTTCVRHLAQI